MSKPNRTGRNDPVERFTTMMLSLMNTPAWRALSPTGQSLYVWVRLEWKGAKANNNGKIRLSIRQAAEKMGVGSLNTIGRAFHDLQAKGFISIREHAVLGVEGEARAPAYELTELPLPGANVGRRLYADWREGGDFPVAKSKANNPTGLSSKSRTLSQLLRRDVADIATFQKRTSQK